MIEHQIRGTPDCDLEKSGTENKRVNFTAVGISGDQISEQTIVQGTHSNVGLTLHQDP